jgi:phytoene dehydrogenase-like protein
MPDATLSQAIKEAYASAPANVVIYHTLELRHPAFTTPIRVVRDYEDLIATLEATAPADPGAAATFKRFAFDFTKPEVSATGVPQMSIEIDNVDRSIVANIEAALATTDLVQGTYREFISTDLSAPQNDPPIHMTIMSITADVFRVKAVAGFPDLINRRFPTSEYDAETFPGLLT